MAWKKPKWVKNVQKSTQSAVNSVVNPVKAGAQSVAKEVGYAVNPLVGELDYRAREAGKNPIIQKIGNKIQEGAKAAMAAPQASNAGLSAPLPLFTDIIPRGIKNTVYGVGDVLAGDVTKGVKGIGSAVGDVAANTGKGLLEVFARGGGGRGVDETTKGDKIGGRSGGASITALPEAQSENSPEPAAKPKPSTTPGPVIPPTPVIGQYLTGQAPKPTAPATPAQQTKAIQDRLKKLFRF